MVYRYLENEMTADIAFEVYAANLPDVFRDSADAVTNVMVENIDSIVLQESCSIDLSNEQLDLLLFDLLQQLIYFKDTEQLLLRIDEIEVIRRENKWWVHAVAKGEKIDLERHITGADVKAVTLHEFSLERIAELWRAHVILDI